MRRANVLVLGGGVVLGCLVGLLLAVGVPPVHAQNDREGTWKLNVAKSILDPGPAFKGQTRRMEPVVAGARNFTVSSAITL